MAFVGVCISRQVTTYMGEIHLSAQTSIILKSVEKYWMLASIQDRKV